LNVEIFETKEPIHLSCRTIHSDGSIYSFAAYPKHVEDAQLTISYNNQDKEVKSNAYVVLSFLRVQPREAIPQKSCEAKSTRL
jgi:hypothetical protein